MACGFSSHLKLANWKTGFEFDAKFPPRSIIAALFLLHRLSEVSCIHTPCTALITAQILLFRFLSSSLSAYLAPSRKFSNLNYSSRAPFATGSSTFLVAPCGTRTTVNQCPHSSFFADHLDIRFSLDLEIEISQTTSLLHTR